MNVIMYAAAPVLAVCLFVSVKELGQNLSAGWNNIVAAGMKTKESFIAEQAKVHAHFFNGEKRRWTYRKKLLAERAIWILIDTLAAGVLFSAGLAPDDYVGIANFLTVLFLTVSFLVNGDTFFTFMQVDNLHKLPEYSEEKLSEFFDAQAEVTERVAPVPVLFGFRVVRLLVIMAAIASVFLA